MEEAQAVTGTAVNEDEGLKSINRNPLINRSGVKKFVLEYCLRSPRTHVRNNMRRVSEQVYTDLEVKMRDWLRNRIDSQPSKGKTVM